MKNWVNYIVLLLFLLFCTQTKGQKNCILSSVRTGCAPFLAEIEYCGPLKEDNTPFPTVYNYGDGTRTTKTSHLYTKEGYFSVSQEIAFQAGMPTIDSTFKNFFRVVSIPKINFRVSQCKDKVLFIEIDSSSYDFYLITNSINSKIDTLYGFGTRRLIFTNTLNTQVNLKIKGKYLDTECEISDSITSDFLDNISPISINTLSEFGKISINYEGVANINYRLSLMANNQEIVSKTSKNTSLIEIEIIQDYQKILFSALDACENLDTALFLNKFTSKTLYSSNQNTISHTSPLFVPQNQIFFNKSTQEILSSNIDTNIKCGITDCYSILSNENFGKYFFERESSGDCGISFSLIKPVIEQITIDNSNSEMTKISIKTNSDIDFVNINNEKIKPLTNNTLSLKFINSCRNVSITNTCQQSSESKTICPVLLNKENTNLDWNGNNIDLYSLLWFSKEKDTNLLALDLLTSYKLNPNALPAQEFCVYVERKTDLSKSNVVCFKDEPFVFIPDLIVKKLTNLNLTTRYLKTYKLKIHDMNGNLVADFNENSFLDISNLSAGTYFYYFDGISENDTTIKQSGSILIKD